MSMSPVIINERSPLSVAKSTQDTTQATTTKKKKYIARAVILSGVGLTGFSVATFARSSSLSGGSGVGGGIRASVDGTDTLFNPYAHSVCVPATGTWSGKSFYNTQGGATQFDTCFKNGTGDECWSSSHLIGGYWYECVPNGHGWNSLNSGAASAGCGSPCLKFEQLEGDDFWS